MKILKLLLLVPFLFAFQCEEEIDSPIHKSLTRLIIDNQTDYELFFITKHNDILTINSNSDFQLIYNHNLEDSPINPSDFDLLSNDEFKLYKTDNDGNLILVYNQTPINNDAWVPCTTTLQSKTSPNINEYCHSLIITDDMISSD